MCMIVNVYLLQSSWLSAYEYLCFPLTVSLFHFDVVKGGEAMETSRFIIGEVLKACIKSGGGCLSTYTIVPRFAIIKKGEYVREKIPSPYFNNVKPF